MSSVSRRFGAYTVTLLRDGFFSAPGDVLTHPGGEAALARARAGLPLREGQPTVAVDVNCFLLRGPSGAMLVDAGTGPAWGANFGHARQALAGEGVAPDEIARVLITHLHGDHALGLVADGAAYFPRAEILVPDAELAFFTSDAARAHTPPARRGGFDVTAAVLEAYGDRVRGIPPGDVLPGITALPLPGHTPGHTGYLVAGEGEGLLIWGDVLHVGEVQAPDPDVGVIYDLDPPLAAASRREALTQAAREGWTVAGGHITGFQKVAAEGDGFRLTPA